MATFHRSLDDDEHGTSSLVNGVDRYRDRQVRHRDDHHQAHQDHHRDDHHQAHQDHQSRHRDDQRQDHQNDLVRHSDDQHRDHQDDRHRDHQDHQVRVCQGQMDALAHQYLQDRDQVRSQEYDRCVLQHLVPLDVHLQEDDPRQELHPDDQEEGELDDRYPEVAVLDDHLDPSAVAAEDEEQ